tara:strand:- start:913 stop:1347 length:435 start_codon:yes stop_codon:yes gene_type:complete
VKPKISFKKINNTDEQLNYLYDSLKKRKFNVSHHDIPSFSEHKDFVLDNPYRVWVLLYISDKLAGNLYIQKDNTIGLHIKDEYINFFPNIIESVLLKWQPLPGIKSVRNDKFIMNVAAGDEKKTSILKNLGAKKIQTSFLLDLK